MLAVADSRNLRFVHRSYFACSLLAGFLEANECVAVYQDCVTILPPVERRLNDAYMGKGVGNGKGTGESQVQAEQRGVHHLVTVRGPKL